MDQVPVRVGGLLQLMDFVRQFGNKNSGGLLARLIECLIAMLFILTLAVSHQSPTWAYCVFIKFQNVRNAVISSIKDLSLSRRAFIFHVPGPRGMDGMRGPQMQCCGQCKGNEICWRI